MTFELEFGTGNSGVGCVGVGELLLGFTVREHEFFSFFERQGGFLVPSIVFPFEGASNTGGDHSTTFALLPLPLFPSSPLRPQNCL